MTDTDKILEAINSLKIVINNNESKIDDVKKIVTETNNKIEIMRSEIDSLKKVDSELKSSYKEQNQKLKS